MLGATKGGLPQNPRRCARRVICRDAHAIPSCSRSPARAPPFRDREALRPIPSIVLVNVLVALSHRLRLRVCGALGHHVRIGLPDLREMLLRTMFLLHLTTCSLAAHPRLLWVIQIEA